MLSLLQSFPDFLDIVPHIHLEINIHNDYEYGRCCRTVSYTHLDVYKRQALNIDPRKITWRRCVDMNDRQLRNVVDGLGGKTNGMPREDGYDITVAVSYTHLDVYKRQGHKH